MKRFLSWLMVPCMLATLIGLPVAAAQSCGDDGIACGEEEHCCEHVIAMFSDDHAVAPPYVQGQCAPKAEKCADFWCGNRHCESGFFGTPSVCCVNQPEQGSSSQYSCAYSELSCPGNSQKLTIRESQPTRTLSRS
jgi:hypothetical protein